MTNRQNEVDGPFGPISRRSAIGSMLAGAALFAPDALGASPQTTAASQGPPAPRKRYDMKKSINLWAFPYPQKMTLVDCLQLAKAAGFDGIELNYDLESDLSPRAGTREFQEIRRAAERIGIAISGLCSFLFWPYPLRHVHVHGHHGDGVHRRPVDGPHRAHRVRRTDAARGGRHRPARERELP